MDDHELPDLTDFLFCIAAVVRGCTTDGEGLPPTTLLDEGSQVTHLLCLLCARPAKCTSCAGHCCAAATLSVRLVSQRLALKHDENELQPRGHLVHSAGVPSLCLLSVPFVIILLDSTYPTAIIINQVRSYASARVLSRATTASPLSNRCWTTSKVCGSTVTPVFLESKRSWHFAGLLSIDDRHKDARCQQALGFSSAHAHSTGLLRIM